MLPELHTEVNNGRIELCLIHRAAAGLEGKILHNVERGLNAPFQRELGCC